MTNTGVPTTTSSGLLPLVVIGAIGLAGIVLAKKRR
jgi:predicted membrane-bound mannosyltransferase